MSQSIEQTLRKSRQVDEKYKAFLASREGQRERMQETDNKIENAQKVIRETRQAIAALDDVYSRYQNLFSKAIENAFQSLQGSMGLLPVDEDFKPWEISDKEFVQLLSKNKNIVFITGAGMSAASGIPTFRGQEGFWTKENQKDKQLSPETILTLSYYRENPFSTWEWIQDFYRLKEKSKPNKGHLALAQIVFSLMNKGKDVTLVTQNIDNFHVEAQQIISEKNKKKGEKKCPILPIHGNATVIRCESCSQKSKQLITFPYDEYRRNLIKHKLALCRECNEPLRPHIMFFDEEYSQNLNRSQTAEKKVDEADLVIIVGTSLSTGLVLKLTKLVVLAEPPKEKIVVDINMKCEINISKVRRMEGPSEEILEKTKLLMMK